ncbi:hypothetical protein LVJ94_31885 [Pendulispora rubella]|uniref:Uncharacterized protein n=1 Tax=Pendulispora rubella TaxID=2741070 RepID=A0ABZ2KS44_9BACT
MLALLDDPQCTADLRLFESHAAQRPERGLGFVPALARWGRASALPLGDLSLDVVAAEVALGGEGVVAPASGLKIARFVAASECARVPMIELEERPRWATLARFVHEGALHTIPREDLAAHGAPDIARSRGFVGRTRGWAFRLTKARRLEAGNEKIEPTFQDDRQIAAGVGVAHQTDGVLDFLS